MSTSGSTRITAAIDATRQKLDELDVLLQQMLNLPVNRLDPEGFGTAEPSSDRNPVPGEANNEPALAFPNMIPEPEDETGQDQELPEKSLETSTNGDGSNDRLEEIEHPVAAEESVDPALRISGYRAIRTETGWEVGKLSESGSPSESQPRELISEPRDTSEAEPNAVSWWLYPVVCLNWIYDGVTFLFGPLGRWLRGETGRFLLGLVGIGLLLTALGWALLEWMGWIR